MKTKRKALLLSLCAVLLVVASVMGTMAYLTSTTGEVKNTFIVGNAVAITLDEADTDNNGVEITGAKRVTENEYKLMPGHSYVKDPTVHVDATSEDCYVFITVSNGISGIESTADGYKNIANQILGNNWKLVNADLGLYVYAKPDDQKTVAKAGENLVVFNNFTVKSDAKIGDLEGVKNANITIKAYAVQVDGFEGMTPAAIAEEAFGLK